MKSISRSSQEPPGDHGAKRRKDYLTTTELAKLCGVSRFTIINWINEGRIRAVKTFGGHRRIRAIDAISLLEHFCLEARQKGDMTVGPGSLGRCWEYRQQTAGASEYGDCGDCLLYGRELDGCFALVRRFGKDVIRCKGDCLDCGYFDGLSRSGREGLGPEKAPHQGRQEATARERPFLETLAYIAGRGVQGVKRTVAVTRDRLAGRSPRARGEAAEQAVGEDPRRHGAASEGKDDR
jgi:excisionase family DNA binding protein